MKKIYHIPSRDPRLKRHIHHDERSRQFAFPTEGLTVQTVKHLRHIPILDQGQVGSCTGNAGIGDLAVDPLFGALPGSPRYALDESGALKLYSDAEVIDGDGPYPPNDNGSSGLSIAKALKNAGLISGYQHTFSLDAALKALSVTPFIFGTNWYDSMFNPDADGRVHISGSIAGGHEIMCRECDAENQRVWFDNSWGESWGVGGRFYLTFEDFGTLLAQQGDVTVLLPLTVPAPTPTPQPPAPTPTPGDPTATFVAIAKPWAAKRHSGDNRVMAEATKAWLAAMSLCVMVMLFAGCGSMVPKETTQKDVVRGATAINASQSVAANRTAETEVPPSAKVDVELPGKRVLNMGELRDAMRDGDKARVRELLQPTNDVSESSGHVHVEVGPQRSTVTGNAVSAQGTDTKQDVQSTSASSIPAGVKLILYGLGLAAIGGAVWFVIHLARKSAGLSAALDLGDNLIAKQIFALEEKLKSETEPAKQAALAQQLASLQQHRGTVAAVRPD